ncbi:hypothetical protein D3C87_2196070 [compost metagenome]
MRLTGSSSVAASMTRSMPAMSLMSAVPEMRDRVDLRSSSVILLLDTWRARLPLMVARPASMRSLERS